MSDAQIFQIFSIMYIAVGIGILINPGFYKVIKEYEKLSGIPSIVNTSFNMHEEPIVCTPRDAIRAFNLGNLDYLAIGPFLVKGQFVQD